MLVPHGAYILTVDGGRTRLFRNIGRERRIELETLEERTLRNPRTHVMSEPAPGRTFQSAGISRSAYDATDTHQRREDAFCEAALDRAIAAAGDAELIVVAPPHVIGVLRQHAARHKRETLREIVKDLTKLTPRELGERLRDHH